MLSNIITRLHSRRADLDIVTKGTKPAITRSERPTAQKANQILLPPDMQQRPLDRPLQIALGYSHVFTRIYHNIRANKIQFYIHFSITFSGFGQTDNFINSLISVIM